MEDYSSYSLLRPYDVYMVPLCFLVIYIITYYKRKKYKDTILYGYYMKGMLWRIFGAIVYTMVSEYYFIFADTNHYYQAVLDMHRAVMDDTSYLQDIYNNMKLKADNPIMDYFLYDQLGITHFYMADAKNYLVPKFALPFSLLFNKSYMAISFCLSFFAFGGFWRVFKMFCQLYPHLHKKLAIAILFLPSLLFWGVALLKDTICIGAMGYFLYAAYSIFVRREKQAISVLILLGSGFLLYNIKPYILICIIPAFLLWQFVRVRVLIQDRTLRQIATFMFTLISLVAAFFVVQSFTASEIASQYSAENIVNTVRAQQRIFTTNQIGSGSNFEVQQVSNSITSLFLLFPTGVMNTFFRPFPWDVRSPLMAFSFLESFAFLVLTYMCFRRIGFRKFFGTVASDPVIIFCFVFSIFFGGLIGMTTINFGALNRYKIPCIPFFLVMLFLIMDKSGKFSPKYIFSKRFF